MLKFISILIALLPIIALHAQQVTNMQVTQEADNVVITYDISSEKSGQTFDIKVECSTDNGKTFSITPLTLTGDLKDVSAGTRKKIVWDVLSERQELAGDQFVFQLVATYSGITGTFTDARDEHVYKWVKIGNQIWMAENLAYLPSVNFAFLPSISLTSESLNQTPLYYVYGYDGTNIKEAKSTKNYITYGALYNWYTVNTEKLAPKGWHVPCDREWTTLTTYLGGEIVAGGKLKETGTIHWAITNTGATNETGFTALPGGYRNETGAFGGIGYQGDWWSTTEEKNSSGYALFRYIRSNYSSISHYNYKMEFGCSVRCIKD